MATGEKNPFSSVRSKLFSNHTPSCFDLVQKLKLLSWFLVVYTKPQNCFWTSNQKPLLLIPSSYCIVNSEFKRITPCLWFSANPIKTFFQRRFWPGKYPVLHFFFHLTIEWDVWKARGFLLCGIGHLLGVIHVKGWVLLSTSKIILLGNSKPIQSNPFWRFL